MNRQSKESIGKHSTNSNFSDDSEKIVDPTNQLPRVLMSVTEAARVLGVSRSYTYELVAAGVLASVRLGRRVLIPSWTIDDLVARSRDGF